MQFGTYYTDMLFAPLNGERLTSLDIGRYRNTSQE